MLCYLSSTHFYFISCQFASTLYAINWSLFIMPPDRGKGFVCGQKNVTSDVQNLIFAYFFLFTGKNKTKWWSWSPKSGPKQKNKENLVKNLIQLVRSALRPNLQMALAISATTATSDAVQGVGERLLWGLVRYVIYKKKIKSYVSLLEACFDLISCSSLSMNIQIMGGNIT